MGQEFAIVGRIQMHYEPIAYAPQVSLTLKTCRLRNRRLNF